MSPIHRFTMRADKCGEPLCRLGKRKSADDSAASLIQACTASRVWSVSSNRIGSRVLCWTTLARAITWLP
jgi:hypothetical protein